MQRLIVYAEEGSNVYDINKLFPFQGDLKFLPEIEKNKLENILLTHGYRFNTFIWNDENSVTWIMDGHQRQVVLMDMVTKNKISGCEVRYYKHKQITKTEVYDNTIMIPCTEIHAENRHEAAKLLLLVTSKFGQFNPETSFIDDFNIDIDFLSSINIPEIYVDVEPVEEISEEEQEEDKYNSDDHRSDDSSDEQGIYTEKIMLWLTEEDIELLHQELDNIPIVMTGSENKSIIYGKKIMIMIQESIRGRN